MRIKVAGAQIIRTMDVAKNLRAIKRMMRRATKDGADFLLTPEGCLSGYTPKFPRAQVRKAVREIEAEIAQWNVNLLLGTCAIERRRDGNGYDRYNQVRVYDRRGTYHGFHAKILLCSSPDRPGTGEMTSYVQGTPRVFHLDGLTFGCLICNDLWATPLCTTYPDIHLTQIMAGMGARVIFHAVCSGGSGQRFRAFHHENLLMRARASHLYIVTANGGYRDRDVNACSGVVGPEGEWLSQANPKGEQYFTYTLEV